MPDQSNSARKPRWTAAEDARLRALRAKGLPNAEIARLLGRGFGAVVYRVGRLGLPYHYRPNEQRFRAFVDQGAPDECWPWLGERDRDGYGRFTRRSDAGHVRAHRFAYELAKGPIPVGSIVMHTCDNPPCVNPAHLRCGTTLDNMRDKVAKGRQYRSRARR